MVKAKQQRRRNRRLKDSANPPPFPTANVTAVVHGTDAVTVTFNAPVMIDPDNLPSTWLFGATPRTVIGLTSSTPTTAVLGLSGTVAATDPYTIGANDPGVRTTSGGYIGYSTGVMT
jgi:hypothetical protein